MNILANQYDLASKSLDIYVSGCNGQPKCKGCHNPETWEFNKGYPYMSYTLETLIPKLKEFKDDIDKIRIFGGEPLDQPITQLEDLIIMLKPYVDEVWLFTRFDIDEIPDTIKSRVDYVKTGRYDCTKLTDDNVQYGVSLASSNQQIHKLK